MKHVDDNSLVPSRGSGGPLAPWIDAFSDWARQQGYSRSAMSRRVSLATGFDAWLEHEGIDPDHLTSDHPARYLRYRARRQRLYDGDVAALRHLIDFLRLEGGGPRREDIGGSEDRGRALRAGLRAISAGIAWSCPGHDTELPAFRSRFSAVSFRQRASDAVGFERRRRRRIRRARGIGFAQDMRKAHDDLVALLPAVCVPS